ncbi:MAG: TRAP transporter small permease [Spongiibacteraceae bacterium]|nr:TRAP transporter small permease [Spongiibacteraceae bacterium]
MTPTLSLKSVVDRLEEGILAALLAFMTCLTFVQVILRYLFNTGLVWSLEATTYSFAWLMLIGISYGVRTQAHIAVDLVSSRLSGKTKFYTELLVVVLCIVYAGLMFYGSAVLVNRLYILGNMARDVAIAKWLLTAIMPVGFALLAFRFTQAGLAIVKKYNASISHNQGVKDNDSDYRKGSE